MPICPWELESVLGQSLEDFSKRHKAFETPRYIGYICAKLQQTSVFGLMEQ